MLLYRKLLPVEVEAYCRHLLRLDSRDRYARFCGAVSDPFVRLHCDRLDWRRTQVVGCFEGGVLRAAAELHVSADWPWEGEVGISVEADLQGQGVGAALLRRILALARNRGLNCLVLHCLAGNRRVQALVRRCSGSLDFDIEECRGAIRPGPPDPAGLLHEAVDDGIGLAAYLSDRFWGLAAAVAAPSLAPFRMVPS